MEILDDHLRNNCDEAQVLKVMGIAFLSTQDSIVAHPSMSRIIEVPTFEQEFQDIWKRMSKVQQASFRCKERLKCVPKARLKHTSLSISSSMPRSFPSFFSAYTIV